MGLLHFLSITDSALDVRDSADRCQIKLYYSTQSVCVCLRIHCWDRDWPNFEIEVVYVCLSFNIVGR